MYNKKINNLVDIDSSKFFIFVHHSFNTRGHGLKLTKKLYSTNGSDQTRGGGLALVYQDDIQISPHKHQTIHTSFDLQLVNICSPGRDFVLANIHRPPSASKSTFLVKFANFLTTLGIDAVNRLIICGDFNLPGNSPDTIDDELTELLHSTSFAQFVDAPTRYDTHHDKWSLLDLVISSSTSFWPHQFLSPAHRNFVIIPSYWHTSVPDAKNLLVDLINIETWRTLTLPHFNNRFWHLLSSRTPIPL